MSNDTGKIIESVELVLEKFDGEVEDGILAERIVIVDDVVVKHEKYENGELVSVEEGGK